jgi:hypothetical protein
VSEEQPMPEYKQGDNVRLTVELRDQNGVGQVDALVVLQGSSSDDLHRELHLTGWPEGHPRGGRHHPKRAEVLLTNEVPLRLRIVEHPDDVRQGPEFLSVGTFW